MSNTTGRKNKNVGWSVYIDMFKSSNCELPIAIDEQNVTN